MIRRLRLASGLVLFAYVTLHLFNHALGLVSLGTAQDALTVISRFWGSRPGTLLLYGALLVHALLAFWALYVRRRFREMSAAEWAQLVLGFLIPPLLAAHVLGTRAIGGIFGIDTGYRYVLAIYFELSPGQGLRQFLGLLAAWLHGCLGLHLWLRFKPGYARWAPWLLALAVLLPTLAATGALSAGRSVVDWLEEPANAAAWISLQETIQDPQKLAVLGRLERGLLGGFALLLLATLAARLLRRWWEHRGGRVALTYPGGRRVTAPRGTTILEASRLAGIPHASLCGGRGRCSTCRVRIGQGLETLAPADEAEQRVLARVGAAPNVRLACQTRPQGDLEVTPLLPPNVTPREAQARPGYLQGQEREIVVLFADLRSFTRFSESRLPYDVVFLLNRYFSAMGTAVERAGGRVDKFIGDGVMALFGVEGTAEAGCRQALEAAQAMARRLAEMNEHLADTIGGRLTMGIGIHVGPAIVGEMGYGQAVSLTAIGDTVNAASRLEALTKDFGAELVVSEEVVRRSGLPLRGERREVSLRGRETTLAVVVVERIAEPAEPAGAPAG
ncbi:adenylate cyclase [Tistlia consotensis]|uniref:Adenylate cyclase n=1 Tax=Tistlia consotensis USBA 355 TaxID=560819 RepID=A0A1Y6BAR3_9PROT|nr:adenylate/guanylate cyclase domain-containing protein [Tistlia consotensis]SME93547.1 adenylate cyclase [Tistlia consotensis USBA 355]SNR28695.1 adenylate cyclase [Tistlia consotensis]